MPKSYEKYVTLFGHETPAARCQAKSKRSQQQCRKAAMKDKLVCRIHGGRSTGAITEQGRKLCADARTVHGRETRQQRKIRSFKFKEMNALMQLLEN